MLPLKTAKKILDLDFMEMSEISLDEPTTTSPGFPPAPPKQPIQDISRWVEKFSLMAAVLSTRFPEKAPELFAYQAAIVRAERNFEGNRWVSYDRCYRREALASKSLDWSIPNTRLYNEAFTGHARSLPRCSHCLQDDHTAASCPRNPAKQWFPWIPDQSSSITPPRTTRPQNSERCRRFNDGRCRHSPATCRFIHKCLDCWGPHPQISCPRSAQQGNRPRSPFHQPPQSQTHFRRV